MANYATSALKLSDTYVNTLPYNLCETAAGTAAKAVSAGDFSLETGATVIVKFKYTNSATNPTLNVSSTGAKAIYYKGAAITASYLKATYTYTFVYNGTQWDLIGEIDTNTQQTIKQDGITGATINRFGTCSTAAGTSAKTVSITTGTFSLEAGAKVTVKFTNANSALAAPTLNVNGTGAKNIFHKGAQITVGANRTLLAGVVEFIYDGAQYHLIGNYIDNNTTYTFNGAVSTIKDDNLTADRALISDSSGKVAVSDVTSTELSYLDGVTSNVQTQLNDKASKTAANTFTGNNVFTNNNFAIRASGANDDSWITLTNSATSSSYAFGIRRPYTNYGLQLRYRPDPTNQDASRPGDANGTSDIYYDIYHQGNYTRIPTATTSASGAMSAADKQKLNGLAMVATSGSYQDLTDTPNTIPCTSFGCYSPEFTVADLITQLISEGAPTIDGQKISSQPIIVSFNGMLGGTFLCKFNNYHSSYYGCEFTDLKNLETFYFEGDSSSLSLYSSLNSSENIQLSLKNVPTFSLSGTTLTISTT